MAFFKKYISTAVFGAFVAVLVGAPYSAHSKSNYSSLVIDANTGQVLHQQNAGSIRYPASLTKMMTLYLTFQALERGKITMNTRFKTSRHAALQQPSKIGLRTNERISVRDAVYAVAIKSANDAAAVLAEGIGKSEPRFAAQMTRVAKSLGMNHTNFANASGLPNKRQTTTAYDMARLAVALKRDYPQYYHLFAKNKFTYKGRTFYSHNRVTKSYRGADGLKTGYIRASGFNLVTSAHRGNKRIIGVVMGGRSTKSRDSSMVKLLDRAFYNLSRGGVKSSQRINIGSTKSSFANYVPTPILRNGLVLGSNAPTPTIKPNAGKNTVSIARFIQNQSSSTNASSTFSRNVKVSNESTFPEPQYKPKKDIFTPRMSTASYTESPFYMGKAANSIENIKPKRIMIRGKTVPLPMIKPSSQNDGIINTSAFSRSRAKGLNIATAQ